MTGTGKSYLLGVAVERLRREPGYDEDTVVVTATTGIAAANNGGVTLHSWSGMDIDPNRSAEDHHKRIQYRNGMMLRYNEVKTLFIDESASVLCAFLTLHSLYPPVGMKSGDELDKFNELCKLMRKNKRPFGGIQVCSLPGLGPNLLTLVVRGGRLRRLLPAAPHCQQQRSRRGRQQERSQVRLRVSQLEGLQALLQPHRGLPSARPWCVSWWSPACDPHPAYRVPGHPQRGQGR